MKEIKNIYDRLDRKILILIAIPLPFFAFSYLNTQSGTLSFDLPEFSSFWVSLTLGMVITILVIQFFNYNATLKRLLTEDMDLIHKIRIYAQATSIRYWGYFFCGLLCAAGLLLFQNPGFTLLYAITLVLLSFSKPTPDRIIYLLKLKGEEKERVLELKRRM